MCPPTTVLSVHGRRFTALTLIGWSASTRVDVRCEPGGVGTRDLENSPVNETSCHGNFPGPGSGPTRGTAPAIPTGWEREKEPVMALSNDEQHTLDEIERGLRDEDPVFVNTVDFDRLRLRRVMTGALVFLLGMVVLVVGEVAAQAQMAVGVIVGVAGFVTMFAAAAWVFIGRRKT